MGELTRGDRKIRLQQHPLLVLQELLATPGELVTREHLIARLWPKGVVDFDTGLNTAVRKLRVALDDVGEIPRYIETLPRKGYRFIGAIDLQPIETLAPTPPQTADMPSGTGSKFEAPVSAAPSRRRFAVAAFMLVAISGSALFFTHTLWRPASLSNVPPAIAGTPSRPIELSIAVLPLRAASTSEADVTLAKIVGDLLRNRLGKLQGTLVIGTSAMPRSRIDGQGLREFAATVHARYLLDGEVQEKQDQLHVAFTLVDARSGTRLWSYEENRKATDLAGLIDEVVLDVAGHLHVGADAIMRSHARSPVNLDAYGLYVRAQELLDNLNIADIQAGLELSRRATVLDPQFARGYLGLSQALVLSGNMGDGKTDAETTELEDEARAARDHALELDPGLGEVLIERARFTSNSVDAEKLLRAGLTLAPNYSLGYQRYAEFLYDEYRRGEAIEAIERARAIDPLKPRLILKAAGLHMFLDSDSSAHDRLMREALAINPKLVYGIEGLGVSRYLFAGEFAEGIRLMEHAIQLDPYADGLKQEIAIMYLDVDDPDAALAVLKLCSGTPSVLIMVAQYQHDRRRAAQLVRAVPLELWDAEFDAQEAWAMRDEAMATGNFKPALDLMQKRYALVAPWAPTKTSGPRLWNRTIGLVYANTLMLAGNVQQGRRLAQTILAQLDSESVGRARYFLSRDRAAALSLLGDKEHALEELRHALGIGHYYHWWYLGELDPVYNELHTDPEFQALVSQAKQHRVQQRALVEELRKSGQIPKR